MRINLNASKDQEHDSTVVLLYYTPKKTQQYGKKILLRTKVKQ